MLKELGPVDISGSGYIVVVVEIQFQHRFVVTSDLENNSVFRTNRASLCRNVLFQRST